MTQGSGNRRGDLIRLDYAALRATPVATDPFPHVVVPNFVPPDRAALGAGRHAAAEQARILPGRSGQRRPGRRRADRGAWRAPNCATAIAEKFGLDLADAPTMLTVRGWTTSATGISTPTAPPSASRCCCISTRIRDAFARHEGCLRLLRGPNDLEDYAVEVPPVNGTLLVFPNGPNVWHGHKTFEGQRYSMQLNYMTTDGKARSELRRHRWSAFVKRLTRRRRSGMRRLMNCISERRNEVPQKGRVAIHPHCSHPRIHVTAPSVTAGS